MKKLILALTLLSSISAFACSCVSPERQLIDNFADWQQISPDDIVMTDLEEEITLLAAGTFINSIYQEVVDGSEASCEAGCSLFGVRYEANVEYKKAGLTCTARLIKPGRKKLMSILEEVNCN